MDDVGRHARGRPSSGPPAVAWDSPRGVSGASHQPVKRFSLFHSLSPWRSSTSRCTIGGDPTRATSATGLHGFDKMAAMAGGPALRVVVVDNDEAALELVVTDLSLEGHDVVGTCLDGATALDLCTQPAARRGGGRPPHAAGTARAGGRSAARPRTRPTFG